MGLQLSRLVQSYVHLGRFSSVLPAFVLPLFLLYVARKTKFAQRWRDRWRRSRARQLRENGFSLEAFESKVPDPFVRLEGGQSEFEQIYELERCITESTYGRLYECRFRTKPQDSLVVKIVPKMKHPLLRAANQGRKRVSGKACKGDLVEADDFRRYMAALQRLKHENVVRYLQFFADSSSFYFVMENCQGRTLVDHWLAQRVWREDAAQPLMSQLLEALKYVHSLGLVHRDVKPENLMTTPIDEDLPVGAIGSAAAFAVPSVRLRLLDFGLGCLQKVATGTVGTPGYIAPEVYHMERYGCSADLFSAGVIMYIFLTGRPPFKAPITPRHLTEHIEALLQGPNFTKAPLPSVSEDGRDLLDWMLLPQATARCTAAEALRHTWFYRGGRAHPDKLEPPVLWKSSSSELRFLKVMGVWSGSASKSQIVIDTGFEAMDTICESGECDESGSASRHSPTLSRQSSNETSGGDHELPAGFKRDADLEELCLGVLRNLEIPVCLSDPAMPDCPVVAISKGFEVLTGYTERRTVGHNCRFLNQARASEIPDDVRYRLKKAVSNKTSFLGVLPNARLDGTPFQNLLHISPIGIGSKEYLIGVQTEVEDSGFDYESGENLEDLLGTTRKVRGMIRQWLRGTGRVQGSMSRQISV